MAAASRGHLEIVKLLLCHNASIDTIDVHEGCAVAAAACEGYVDASLWLLEHGADAYGIARQWEEGSAGRVYFKLEPIPNEVMAWRFAAESPYRLVIAAYQAPQLSRTLKTSLAIR